ncbi:MAG TPA: PAS domain S-box protein [Pirellulales bacterium]|nr:PAS domain S-box protein [Pirellulales bacterium]
MEINLELLKHVGWPQIDLTPSDRAEAASGRTDQTVDPEDPAVWTTLFDHAPCAIAIVDCAGKLTRVNRKFCALVGYAPAEVIHRRLGELICRMGQSESNASAAGEEAFSCGAQERICAFTKSDASRVWCHQITIPGGNGTKQPPWAICYFNELHESTEALQMLVESHQTLVQRHSAQLEALGQELQTVGRLAKKLDREQALLLERQINQLLCWLAPLRRDLSVPEKSGLLIESAYRSATELQQMVSGAAVEDRLPWAAA